MGNFDEMFIRNIYKKAQMNMLNDGFVDPTVFIIKNETIVAIAPLDFETPEEKYKELFKANLTAAITDSDAISMVAEAWQSTDLSKPPSEASDKKEVVQVIYMDAYGTGLSIVGDIKRTESGRAYLEGHRDIFEVEKINLFRQWKYAEGQDHSNTILITDSLVPKN